MVGAATETTTAVCHPHLNTKTHFSVLWTRLVYCVSWWHVAWLFYWSLALKCGCSESCELARGQDFHPYPGSWETNDSLVFTRWFPSIPPCSWPRQGFVGHTTRHEVPGCLLPSSHLLPTLGRRSLASWLLGWLAGQEPPMGKKWPRATWQARLSQGSNITAPWGSN